MILNVYINDRNQINIMSIWDFGGGSSGVEW